MLGERENSKHHGACHDNSPPSQASFSFRRLLSAYRGPL
jgi:hypothetical protein